jgi:hypothetical protein
MVDKLDPFYSPARKKSNLEEIRRTGVHGFANQDIRIGNGMRELTVRVRPESAAASIRVREH